MLTCVIIYYLWTRLPVWLCIVYVRADLFLIMYCLSTCFGGLVVKFWCSHYRGPGSFPGQGTTPSVCRLSYCGGCIWLWCWKPCHRCFKYQQNHSWWTGFSGASRLDRLGGRTWPPTLEKIGCEKQWTIVWYSAARWEDGAKDQASFCSAVHRVALLCTGSLWVKIDSRALTTTKLCNKYYILMYINVYLYTYFCIFLL